MSMLEKYAPEIEHQMQSFCSKLNERERRHYAAVEALKLGYGGKKYICGLLGLHRQTLKKAIDELTHPELFAPVALVQQRRAGGGRKKKQPIILIANPSFTL